MRNVTERETATKRGTLVKMTASQAQREHQSAEVVEIQRAIEASHTRIRDNVQTLQEQLRHRLDWRNWVREHPFEAVGIAFGLGLFLGARRHL